MVCLGVTVLFLLAGGLLGVWSQEKEPIKMLERPAWGEGGREVCLRAEDEAGGWQEITVTVQERRCRAAETAAFLEQAEAYVREEALGENKGWEKITEGLPFPGQVPGLPVELYWNVAEGEYFDRQGQLYRERIPSEGVDIKIRVVLLCQGERRDVEINGHILPPVWTEEESWKHSVESLVQQREKMLAAEEKIMLPADFEGGQLTYYENLGESSRGGEWLLFSLGAGIFLYVALKREEKIKRERRQRELMARYPAFVEKLLLYLGAGISMRNIFFKLAEEEKEGPLGRALSSACSRLKNGDTEGKVYLWFGEQIGLLPFIRLGGLLSQNLRSGTGEIMNFLEREVEQSFFDRKERAKQRGEEISVKLLLPMGVLLFLTLGIVMVPAFLQF